MISKRKKVKQNKYYNSSIKERNKANGKKVQNLYRYHNILLEREGEIIVINILNIDINDKTDVRKRIEKSINDVTIACIHL